VTAASASATVLLNLAQQQPLSVPAKTFEQLACGREILLVCERGCETASLVAGVLGVKVVDPADADAMQQTLLDLYRRHAVRGMAHVPTDSEVAQFSRASANGRFVTVLEAAAAAPGTRSH